VDVPNARPDPYFRTTVPFDLDGVRQVVEVGEYRQQVRRLRLPSRDVMNETLWPVTGRGCFIEEIAAAPSGRWLVTQRISGQGEWGYDVFRTEPLERIAGVVEEKGYILGLPRFSAVESFLVGGAGKGFLGGWWAHPDDEIDQPARGGPVCLGFLFVHRLPAHTVTRHELQICLPAGWMPDDPWGPWYGPQEIEPTANGVRLVPSWGVPVQVAFPLPDIIQLPVPHPSGNGLATSVH
jgi:hypothetical protein